MTNEPDPIEQDSAAGEPESEPPPAAAGAPPPDAAAPPPAQQAPTPVGDRLIRSLDDRMIAGVCGGLARATGTDPILFRVILAVLVFFGGVGALLYLLAWLLLPADGESASPLGALLGRVRSATGAVLTVVLAAAAILLLSWVPGPTFPANALLLAVLALAAYLLLRRNGGVSSPPGTTPPPANEPFAPHGPYSHSAGPASPLPTSQTPTTLTPLPGQPVAPAHAQPRQSADRVRLGRITLALVCIVIAAMIITELISTSMEIPVGAYFATALAITGIGLVVGTWLGRARGLIALGVALGIGLAISAAAAGATDREITWTPQTSGELLRYYEAGAGDATLDLRQLRYEADTAQQVRVRLGAGTLTVRLPEETTARVSAHVGVGKLDLLGDRSDGAGLSDRRVANPDQTGGSLALDLALGVGHLEVTR